MDQDLYNVILAAAGNRADAVAKAISDYLEPDDDADQGQAEAAAEGNAAVEGAEAEDTVPVEAAESE